MRSVPEVVTFDFHDTLAQCDDWFQLEIRGLLPAFLSWLSSLNGSGPVDIPPDKAVTAYRRLRTEIMEHGMEMDAVTCVDAVTREFGLVLDTMTLEEGVQDVMRETLEGSEPVHGVIDGVRRLKASGVRLGVISSAAYHPFLEWSLDKFGILGEFDSITTSASCGFYKSRTEIYSIALESLKAVPAQAVHIGDSHRFDVIPASRLGIRTVWYNRQNEHVEHEPADAVVTTLEDIDQVVFGLSSGVGR